jgi:hypothetical protein
MKKQILFLLMAFLYMGVYAKADQPVKRYRMAQPIKINVRHITFYVFPNGDFDFNTHGRKYKYGHRRGIHIKRDRFGKIIRVGNVFINYNRYGQISRIGKVFIKYNRRGLVKRVGHKYIHYTRRGYYVTRKPFRPNVGLGISIYADNTFDTCDFTSYDEDFVYDYHDYNYNGYDNDEYYYRPNKSGLRHKSTSKVKNRRR